MLNLVLQDHSAGSFGTPDVSTIILGSLPRREDQWSCTAFVNGFLAVYKCLNPTRILDNGRGVCVSNGDDGCRIQIS